MSEAKVVVNFRNYHANQNGSIIFLRNLNENAKGDLENAFHQIFPNQNVKEDMRRGGLLEMPKITMITSQISNQVF